MRDVAFIQFFKKDRWYYDPDVRLMKLQNGFSTVHQECKNMGDMVWVDIDAPVTPITRGTAYVSTWYEEDVAQVLAWARANPELNIVAGGPFFNGAQRRSLRTHPFNLKICRGTIEKEVFDDRVCGIWGLEPPTTTMSLNYTFIIDHCRSCYWGQCIYCETTREGYFESRQITDIPIVASEGHKYIWLYTLALKPETIRAIYPNLPARSDTTYIAFARSEKKTRVALAEALPQCPVQGNNLIFEIGVELPSDRMLAFMKKGLNANDLLEMIRVLTDNHCRINFNLILGWNTLREEDVRSVEEFMRKLKGISDGSNLSADLYFLKVKQNTRLHEIYQNVKPVHYDLFNTTYYAPILDAEQKRLNLEIRDMYHAFPFGTLNDRTIADFLAA